MLQYSTLSLPHAIMPCISGQRDSIEKRLWFLMPDATVRVCQYVRKMPCHCAIKDELFCAMIK